MRRATLQHDPSIQSRLAVVRGSILHPSEPTQCLHSVPWRPERLRGPTSLRPSSPIQHLMRNNASMSPLSLHMLNAFATKPAKDRRAGAAVHTGGPRCHCGAPAVPPMEGTPSGTPVRTPLFFCRLPGCSGFQTNGAAAFRMSQIHLACQVRREGPAGIKEEVSGMKGAALL